MRGHAIERSFPVLLSLALVTGCGGGTGTPGQVDDWTLYTRLFEARRFEITAPAGVLATRAEELASYLERRTGFEVELRGPDGPRDRGAVRIVLGLFGDPEIARLAEGFGAVVEGGGFRVLDRRHDAPSDALIVVAPDPDRGGLPLVLFAGLDAELLARRVDEVPAPWVPHLWTYRDGGAGLDVPLRPDGGTDSARLVDRSRAREAFTPASRHASEGLVLWTGEGVDVERAAAYAAACEASLARVLGWFAGDAAAWSPGEDPLEVFLHAHTEDFALVTGRDALSHVDSATERIDALLEPGVPDDGGAAVARAAATRLLGSARVSWLADGLGVAAAGDYWGRELSGWIGLLREAEAIPRAADLVRGDARLRYSEHVVVPARGVMALESLEADAAAFARAWRGEDVFRPGKIKRGRVSASVRKERAARLRAAVAPGRRGVALHDGAGPSGYGTRLARESLEQAHSLGADTFSLTLQVASQPLVPMLIADDSVFGSATDVAVVSTLAAGAALGLSEVLVIEPMLAPWSTRIDGANMVDTAEIQRVFGQFERQATHYALLAELARVDVLCLGADMRRASDTLPDEEDRPVMVQAKEQRLAGWRRVFGSARGIFAGALTYAADLRDESDQIAFWGDLDLVGLIGFGRIAWRDTEYEDGLPIDRQIRSSLRGRFGQAQELSSTADRPALFLQLGFPARVDSYAAPNVPAGEVSERAQERYYDALATVVSSWSTRGVGLILWSWNVDTDRSAPGGYSPRGRAAGAHLDRILRRR